MGLGGFIVCQSGDKSQGSTAESTGPVLLSVPPSTLWRSDRQQSWHLYQSYTASPMEGIGNHVQLPSTEPR